MSKKKFKRNKRVFSILHSPNPISTTEYNAIIRSLSFHERDLLVDCPNKHCEAPPGYECRNLDLPMVTVHFGRRLKRLLSGIT